MLLDDFLKSYEFLTLASRSDNVEILKFYKKLLMVQKDSNVSYDRSPDFFSFLDFSGGRSFVFLLRDKEGGLKGVGTVILRDGYREGKKVALCYLSDLRVSTLKMTVYWRRFYADFLKSLVDIEEFNNCILNYTVILDENELAKKSLVNDKNPYCYSLIDKYFMVNIFSPSLFVKENSKYLIRFYEDVDKDELASFLNEEGAKRTLGYDFSKEFDRRVEGWEHFLENTLVVRDKRLKIVGVTSLTSVSKHKKINISGLSSFIKLFYRIVKGSPRVDDTLTPLYMTNLLIRNDLNQMDKELVLKNLILFIFKNGLVSKYHFLTFSDFDQSSLSGAYKLMYHQKTPASLYRVTGEDETNVEEKIKVYPSYLEIALV